MQTTSGYVTTPPCPLPPVQRWHPLDAGKLGEAKQISSALFWIGRSARLRTEALAFGKICSQFDQDRQPSMSHPVVVSGQRDHQPRLDTAPTIAGRACFSLHRNVPAREERLWTYTLRRHVPTDRLRDTKLHALAFETPSRFSPLLLRDSGNTPLRSASAQRLEGQTKCPLSR